MDIVVYGLSKTGTSALFYKLKHSLPPDTICLFEPRGRGAVARLRVRLKAALTGAPPRGVLAKVLPFRPGRPVRTGDFAGFDKQILLVRDPRDRLVSQLLYRVYNSRIWARDAAVAELVAAIRRKEAEPAAVPLTALIATFARLDGYPGAFGDWAEGYGHYSIRRPLAFHDARPDIHVMRYEDIVDGRFATLEVYVGMPLPGSTEVGEEVRRVARTRSYGAWRDWFTAGDIEAIGPLLQPYLDRYYPAADWRLNPQPALDPAHGSGYVEMVARERRSKSR